MRTLEAEKVTNNQHAAFGRIGSLWSEGVTADTKTSIRKLVRSVLQAKAYTGVAETETEINAKDDVFVDYFSMPMSSKNYHHVQGDIASQLESLAGNPENLVSLITQPEYPEHPQWTSLFAGGYVIRSAYGDILLWYDPVDPGEINISAENAASTWVVSVPSKITCTRIQRETGTWMFRGSDFHSAPGVVVLYEDPSVAFPSQKATACGYKPKHGSYNYTLQLDGVSTPGYWVMNYYKNAQGLASFRRAIAEACGLHVWYENSHIIARQKMPVGYTYWTTKEKVRAWYPHTGLEIGSLVTRGDIVVDAEDFSVESPSDDLVITLAEPLFIGMFKQRAISFINREKPVGVPITITILEET